MNILSVYLAFALIPFAATPPPWVVKPSELDWTMHWNVRRGVIEDQYLQARPNPALLLGDSLTERLLTTATDGNGCSVINAGFGGINLFHLLKFTEYFLEGRRFSVIIMFVGINDVGVEETNPRLKEWKQLYTKMVKRIRASGARLVTVTLPPVEKNLVPALSTKLIVEMNKHIRDTARENRAELIDLYSAWAGPDGLAPAGSTSDGLHFSAERSKEYWKLVEKHLSCRP